MKVIVSGLSDAMKVLISAANNHPAKLKQQVRESSRTILNNAKRKVAKGIGADLAKSGAVDYPTDTTGIVSFSNEYAPFVEFGTGQAASKYVPTLPDEFQKLAMSFYVNGKGRSKSQPYLVPAFMEEKPNFITKCEKIVKNEI